MVAPVAYQRLALAVAVAVVILSWARRRLQSLLLHRGERLLGARQLLRTRVLQRVRKFKPRDFNF